MEHKPLRTGFYGFLSPGIAYLYKQNGKWVVDSYEWIERDEDIDSINSVQVAEPVQPDAKGTIGFRRLKPSEVEKILTDGERVASFIKSHRSSQSSPLCTSSLTPEQKRKLDLNLSEPSYGPPAVGNR